jgi:threonine dehydrogenase-like Zn-dependent dehydrogenase
MRAITVLPGTKNSARLDDVSEPSESQGALLVEAIALGVCGTDREILAGLYGAAPAGQQRLILGHESLGRVADAPRDSGLKRDDIVVGIVRHPDPVPCPACAAGEWDMCRNGRYTEHGIKERHGFGAERFRIEPEFAIKVDPALGIVAVLMEPASIVAKAWEQVETIGRRSPSWRPRNLLVTGAGPIGLLAALMGMQRKLQVHVFDRNKEGPKPTLIRDLGGTHHPDIASLRDLQFDIVMECTAASLVIVEAIARCAPSGIVCLLGVSASGNKIEFDLGGFNRKAVLNNEVVFGAVNANLRHYRFAAEALTRADKAWLERLINRRVPLVRWQEALEHRRGDIKVVIDFKQ